MLNDQFLALPGEFEVAQAVFPLFIVVPVLGVLIDGGEFRAFQIIDIEGELIDLFLPHVLLHRVFRDNGPRLDKDGYLVDVGGHPFFHSPVHDFPRPVIVPLPAGDIHPPPFGVWLLHRADQDLFPEDELIGAEVRLVVQLVVVHQGFQHGHPFLDVLPEHGVEVGQQLVAQLDELAHDAGNFLVKGPGLLVPVVPAGMHPAKRVENPQLYPPRKEFPVGLLGKPADVGARKRHPAHAEALNLNVGDPQVFPGGHVVPGPGTRKPLRPGIRGTGDDKRPFGKNVFFDPFIGGAHHLHPVNIVGLPMAAGVAVVVMARIQGGRFARHFHHGRLVHVVPDRVDPGILNQVLVELRPPLAHLRVGKIGKTAGSGPNLALHYRPVGPLAEIVVFECLLVHPVVAVHLDPRVDHDHGLETVLLEF